MKRSGRVLVLVCLTLAILGYLAYRESVAVRAAEFLPIAPTLPPLPAGTEIQVVLSKGITEGTRPGDIITAFISAPVLVHGIATLPSGIQVKGIVEQIERKRKRAWVQLRFNQIVFNDKSSPIETNSVLTQTRNTRDATLLSGALNTLAGAGIGMAIGSASQDSNTIVAGLGQGTIAGLPGPTSKSTKLTLVLTQTLRIPT